MGKGSGPACSERPVLALDARSSIEPIIKARFYRSGEMSKASDYGEEAGVIFAAADAMCPPDRVGRLQGLFSSVGIADMAVWYRSNLGCHYAHTPREIFYHGPDPYVYNVELWNQASAAYSMFQGDDYEAERQAAFAEYWASGVPSRQFDVSRDHYTAGHRNDIWEVLLDPAHITSYRDMSSRRVITHARDLDEQQLMHKLYPKLASRGKCY